MLNWYVAMHPTCAFGTPSHIFYSHRHFRPQTSIRCDLSSADWRIRVRGLERLHKLPAAKVNYHNTRRFYPTFTRDQAAQLHKYIIRLLDDHVPACRARALETVQRVCQAEDSATSRTFASAALQALVNEPRFLPCIGELAQVVCPIPITAACLRAFTNNAANKPAQQR